MEYNKKEDLVILNDNVNGAVLDIGIGKTIGYCGVDDEQIGDNGVFIGYLLFDEVSENNKCKVEFNMPHRPTNKSHLDRNPEDYDVAIRIHSIEALNLLRRDLDEIEKLMTGEEKL